jgi:hypothetical protein
LRYNLKAEASSYAEAKQASLAPRLDPARRGFVYPPIILQGCGFDNKSIENPDIFVSCSGFISIRLLRG